MNLLKLKPAYKDYIWGGQKLKTNYNKEFEGDRLAETWELSTHKDGASIVEIEPGNSCDFHNFIENAPKDILGSNCAKYEDFPLLIKFIDAKEDLSIQVHPNNDYAAKSENQFGKTEVWYVVDCNPNSYIYYGLTREITKKEFKNYIQNNTLLEVLNKVYVKKGDVFLIEAGTIHAIGKDIVIAEIQQNSNVTYRIYDYNRRDLHGNTRELHIQKALDVVLLKPAIKNIDDNKHLASCEYFTVDKIELNDSIYTHKITDKSFIHILVIDGKGCINVENDTHSYKKGDSFFVPAVTKNEEKTLKIQGSATLLLTTVN